MRWSIAVAALLLAACGGSPTSGPGSSAAPTGTPSSASSGASGSPTASGAPVVVPTAPQDGACYQYDVTAAVAPTNDSRPVDCRKPHDAKTFFVGRLDQVVDGHLISVDSRRAHRQVASTCPAKLGKLLGGSAEALRLSVLATVWFTPTVADSDAGANWFRCDVVAPVSGRLMPLNRSLRGVLARPDDARRYGRCRATEPGSGTDQLIPCTGPHQWRAVQVVELGSGSYPANAETAGQTTCKDLGRSRAANPLDYQWAYEWPSRQQWDAGQHWGFCWLPDSS